LPGGRYYDEILEDAANAMLAYRCAAIPALPALSGLIPASGGGLQILTVTEVKLA